MIIWWIWSINIAEYDLFYAIIVASEYGNVFTIVITVMMFFVILKMEYLSYLLHIEQQNLVVYLIFVKKRKEKDCLILMLVYYVKLLELYLMQFVVRLLQFGLLLIIYLMIIKNKCFLQVLYFMQQKLIYLVIFEKECSFVHYLHFLQIIFVFVGKGRNQKGCFLLYYWIQQHVIDVTLIVFYVFLDDETILLPSQSSDITSNPTAPPSFSTLSTPDLTPVATYSAPLTTPNHIFTRISRYFDVCKLVFGVFLNVIVCLFGNNFVWCMR